MRQRARGRLRRPGATHHTKETSSDAHCDALTGRSVASARCSPHGHGGTARRTASTSLLAAKRRSGAPILDLTESNPTRAGIPYAPDILDSLAAPESLRYDPDPRGLLVGREAVAADYRRRGVHVDPLQLVLTASTSEAYSVVFQLLCDPGDAVLVPQPSYPLFDFLATLASVRVERYPLSYDGSWHVDFSALAASVTSSTKAVVVVNPNNPTGSFLKRDEAERLLDLCATRRLAVIADEVSRTSLHC